MTRLLFIACLFVVSNQAFAQNGSCELIDNASDIKQEFDDNAGCKDEGACNYNSEAKYSNYDLCEYSCYGCTDETACNFNIDATEEDDSCTYPSAEYLDCNDCCVNDEDRDGICDEEERETEQAMREWLEDGKNPSDFLCAFEPKCLDECGVPYGDGSSCIEEKEEESTMEIEEESAIVKLFREGGTGFMMCVLICLILGLAICIERIIYLMMASSNSTVLLSKIESELKNGQLENAKEVCRNTAGPTASICLQGLERSNESVESIEKSIMAYGSVQMGLLEKGTSWISLFIAIAPMLGFMGTVIGMIGAFNSIEAAGDISPSLVAGGIKQALLTTVFGLIVAIILQIFYNFIISKIDDIVNDMEDTSIALVDLIASNKK